MSAGVLPGSCTIKTVVYQEALSLIGTCYDRACV